MKSQLSDLTCKTSQRGWRCWPQVVCACTRFRDRRDRCRGGRGSARPLHSEPPGAAHWGPLMWGGAGWGGSPWVRERWRKRYKKWESLGQLFLNHSERLCYTVYHIIEGIVHPKTEIHSLSTHHYVDRGVGEELSPQNNFGVSGINSIAAKCNIIVYPWNTRSVVWTQTLHPPLYLHSGEFPFLGELSL